mmetsp:Transcript_21810/g.41774  ORF Transcript_21810/g.41774 Transcript_21810/m.41774 type:complete len:80 (+) Transcript_21810:170-409(+)
MRSFACERARRLSTSQLNTSNVRKSTVVDITVSQKGITKSKGGKRLTQAQPIFRFIPPGITHRQLQDYCEQFPRVSFRA